VKVFLRQRLLTVSTASCGVWNVVGDAAVGETSSILLGPEIIAAVGGGFFSGSASALNTGGCGLVWFGCGGAGLVLVENCTVDASIFVVKLLRAYGGCLGTRSR
jgi:hypothetical protein